jgi:serine/threonine protein kinase
MLSALHYLHCSLVIHRDLKPANILVCCADTSIKIADFGLARVVGADLVHRGAGMGARGKITTTNIITSSSSSSMEDEIMGEGEEEVGEEDNFIMLE